MASWFGASWGAPVCEPERHAPTPVGRGCADCGLAITVADRGMLIPFASDPVTVQPWHLGCFLRSIGVGVTVPQYDADDGAFLGHLPRGCGEHRTVGEHRAWCFDCREWCYPHDGCIRCRHPDD